MKVIIAGGREFNDFETLRVFCDLILQNQSEVEIVSGGASGADALGERYASDAGYPISKFPADWSKHGRKAGPIRNEEMAVYADALIAFDTGGRGTADMIRRARKHGLKVAVKSCC